MTPRLLNTRFVVASLALRNPVLPAFHAGSTGFGPLPGGARGRGFSQSGKAYYYPK